MPKTTVPPLDLGCKGAQPLSLVVDHTGIYYDATEPSDLENLLNGSGGDLEGQLQSVQHAIEAIKRHDLSKYNHAPRAAEKLLGDASCPRVLILDQTKGDTSVTLGRADAESFTAMLDDAQMRFPNARLFRLEFENVYIIDANEGIMPYKKAVLEKDIEEERRLFYVDRKSVV